MKNNTNSLFIAVHKYCYVAIIVILYIQFPKYFVIELDSRDLVSPNSVRVLCCFSLPAFITFLYQKPMLFCTITSDPVHYNNYGRVNNKTCT